MWFRRKEVKIGDMEISILLQYLKILSKSGPSSRWIGVLCVKRMESLQITFFFIVRLLVLMGMSSSNVSGCLGLCLDE
jgi:hypothetical protein